MNKPLTGTPTNATANAPVKTTVKFTLENPFYQWPAHPPMDHQILISKLTDLKASISADEWKESCVVDANELMRLLEAGKLSVVFAFKADLRFTVAVAHLPFMCRQAGCALVELTAGAAKELSALLRPAAKKDDNLLFMFALKRGVSAIDAWASQFPLQPAIDVGNLPILQVSSNKK